MESFNTICRKIKNLEIQGAQAVAIAAVKALKFKNDKKSVEKILSLRPTEPCLRNAVKFVLQDLEKNYSLALKHLEGSGKKIAQIGSRKIREGCIVFTHCHSSTVVSILKEAKKSGKKFEVYNTETRPLFQGRKTAAELAKAKIPVTHFVDSAARIALKKADIMLLGCDAITSERVLNKIGSEMFAEIAKRYDIPLYICTDSWKFNPETFFGWEEKIEIRKPKEVWSKPPKGVNIRNLAFERIKPDLITAIISELGDYRFSMFIEEVRKNYPWIFSNLKK